MNPIKYGLLWIVGKEPKSEKYVTTNLNQENEETKALRKQLATTQAQLNKISAEEKRTKENEKEKDKTQETIKELNEQLRKINKDKIGDTTSLKSFFDYFVNNKNWKNIEVTDKDDHFVFGKLGDIVISNKTGNLVLLDAYGNPLSQGSRIDNIIFKPETLGNQLKRKRILIPKDKDFNPIMDLEKVQINDVVYKEEQKVFEETEEFRDTVRNLLMRRDKENMNLREKTSRLELTNQKLTAKLFDLERAMKLYENVKNVKQSELSQAVEMNNQTIQQIGDLQRKLSDLSGWKTYYEQKEKVNEMIIQKLLAKIEKGGDKTLYDEAKADVQGDLERYKAVLPETVIIQEEKEKPQPKMPNPGEVIGQRRNQPQ